MPLQLVLQRTCWALKKPPDLGWGHRPGVQLVAWLHSALTGGWANPCFLCLPREDRRWVPREPGCIRLLPLHLPVRSAGMLVSRPSLWVTWVTWGGAISQVPAPLTCFVPTALTQPHQASGPLPSAVPSEGPFSAALSGLLPPTPPGGVSC